MEAAAKSRGKRVSVTVDYGLLGDGGCVGQSELANTSWRRGKGEYDYECISRGLRIVGQLAADVQKGGLGVVVLRSRRDVAALSSRLFGRMQVVYGPSTTATAATQSL